MIVCMFRFWMYTGHDKFVLCFLQFLECVSEDNMVPYGVLYRNIK